MPPPPPEDEDVDRPGNDGAHPGGEKDQPPVRDRSRGQLGPRARYGHGAGGAPLSGYSDVQMCLSILSQVLSCYFTPPRIFLTATARLPYLHIPQCKQGAHSAVNAT